MVISKTDYLLYRECRKSTWIKKNKPDIYYKNELTEFEKLIIQTGNEVELIARDLFPSGVLISGRDEASQTLTTEYINKKQPVIFQAVFEKNGFLCATDILEFDPTTNSYNLYEVKASNEIDKKVHFYDLAFQLVLLRKCGLTVKKICLIHLDKEYIRHGALNKQSLFKLEDVTEEIESLCGEVSEQMDIALAYLSQSTLPAGFCDCVYKGRSNHCNCFSFLNPSIPEYSVHDLARIGLSKNKLEELVDGKYYRPEDVPAHISFSQIQQNQIDSYKQDKLIVDKEAIKKELLGLEFPLYFIDYETFPSVIPRFDKFSPYNQIPFQYSLYVLDNPSIEPRLVEFLYSGSDDPTPHFFSSQKENIGSTGNIIVWHKGFECARNNEMAIRVPESKNFFDSFNERVFDLEEIFKKQHYVHKDFKGSTSIKKVLPVLVPSLSYKDLDIKDGGSAAEVWSKLTTEILSLEGKEKIIKNLKTYCSLDTYAMYALWNELFSLIS